MAHRAGDRDRPALQHTRQRETLDADRVHHRLQIAHPGLERQLRNVPVREPAAPFVVAHAVARGAESDLLLLAGHAKSAALPSGSFGL